MAEGKYYPQHFVFLEYLVVKLVFLRLEVASKETESGKRYYYSCTFWFSLPFSSFCTPFRFKCERRRSRQSELLAFGVLAKHTCSCGASTVQDYMIVIF